jgi:hypothetical protein
MARYYRIQPAGLGLDHLSETSVDEPADGLHVFDSILQTFATDGPIEAYGDEVVVIEADRHWANGDVEGVCVDGARANVVARYSWPAWCRLAASLVTEWPDGEPQSDEEFADVVRYLEWDDEDEKRLEALVR